jgi:hypothetical protein
MSSWLLDAGALVAIEKRDRRLAAMLRVIQQAGHPVRTSAAVVAQVWRGGPRQANLSRILTGVAIRALDVGDGRQAGELQGRAGTSDVVDAHLALMIGPGDQVLTSDPDDIDRLLDIRGVDATVVRV